VKPSRSMGIAGWEWEVVCRVGDAFEGSYWAGPHLGPGWPHMSVMIVRVYPWPCLVREMF
jgi:hypothetical protein